MFVDRVIHFGENLGDQVKDRTLKKLKSLIRVPYVVHLKVKVLGINVIHISSPYCDPRPSYPFWGKFRRSGERSFTEKAKMVNSSTLCSAPESTGSKHQ